MPNASPETRRVRMLLHTPFAGPVAFLLLADERGYLREHGLTFDFVEGAGAAGIVPQVKAPDFDAGYGDMTALIEAIAHCPPDRGPVAVFSTFNTVPFTIAVPAAGPIHAPGDLVGCSISGYAVDAALLTFDMFAKATGIDPSLVTVIKSPDTMEGQIEGLLWRGEVDGVFGFVNTIIAKAASVGIDGVAELRFFPYAEYLPDMYGNTMFVTRELYERDKPALVGMVDAFNRALRETVADPDIAIDALMRRAPTALREVDRTRLIGTLRSDMGHPEGQRIGVGDMDDARLGRMIDLVVAAKRLPRTPSIREVFDRSFLPPMAERVTDMTRVPD